MLTGRELVDILIEADCEFFTGVPDSTISAFCHALTTVNRVTHIPAANEGAAISLAIGWHLATGTIPVVYCQNSGLLNALNPYLSLCHKRIYDIPMILVVGWRGQPGTPDEAQHAIVGARTLSLLEMMDLEILVLKASEDSSASRISEFVVKNAKSGRSAAIVVPVNVLTSADTLPPAATVINLTRREVVAAVVTEMAPEDFIVAGIGHTSRELYSVRQQMNCDRSRQLSDFLCVGGMGHALQVAVGIAIAKPTKRIWCFEGDASFLMNLGASAVVGVAIPKELTYVLLDNRVNASVGGQRTPCEQVNYCAVARELGFASAMCVERREEMDAVLRNLQGKLGPRFLWTRIVDEGIKGLPRPCEPFEMRKRFAMQALRTG